MCKQSVTFTPWPLNMGQTGIIKSQILCLLVISHLILHLCNVYLTVLSYLFLKHVFMYFLIMEHLYRQACFINRQDGKYNRQAVKLIDRPVARQMKLGSVTRVGNGRRNIKHVGYFTDSS